MIRLLTVLLLLAATLPVSASCICADTSLAARQSEATHIFEGRVVRVESNWISGGMKYTFAVARNWGNSTDKIIVVNTPFDRDCGYHFDQGRTYLVFATRKFTIKTFFCSGNQPIGQAGADLARLGPGKAPHPSAQISSMIWIVTALGAFATLFVGLVVTRKFWKKS